MRIDLPAPASALAIGAHPDDIEFECGATLAKWAAAGATVHLVVCTDGSKGTWDIDADTDALIARRQTEQQEAARRLGVTGEVRFLGAEDGELDHTVERRSDLSRIIRELQPEVVLGHDPWQRWRIHPDHRTAGWLTVDAVVAARDPHYHREHGIAHHRPAALLLFECEEPDHLENVEQPHLDAKISALLAHESQFETTMEIDTDDDGTQALRFRRRILGEARDHGRRGGVRYAEAFRLIDPGS
ncbi:MAG: PIG-L family deacetylase [Acidimicrobiaceae bacterium]|nr:PIG-L family deacetylase [Acidimicrobiaceae bacterium]MYC41501.1 PIG-L family deacetylase [Acidimicrobiaceae bacterium]MYH87565.1 PIG-L family deacetylase [Acidimicrobiaceae bacterium]